MKSLLLSLTPYFILDAYRAIKRRIVHRRRGNRSTEEVFTEIYTKNKWGGEKGLFFSGGGTHDDSIASAYVEKIHELAQSLGFAGTRFVDLGCGDFRIGQKLAPLGGHYCGVDIAKPVIEHHQKSYASERISFVHLNMISDPLPDGEVCFIRQVLQHLSNSQIKQILPKLKKYRFIFITEHLPTKNAAIVPNIDKEQGDDIRLFQNSGIYLDQPPFSLPPGNLSTVLELNGHGFNFQKDPGVIRTVLYQP